MVFRIPRCYRVIQFHRENPIIEAELRSLQFVGFTARGHDVFIQQYGLQLMKSKVARIAHKLQKLDGEQLEFIRCWLNELEGPNRTEAHQLMKLLMADKITDEEACRALYSIKSKNMEASH